MKLLYKMAQEFIAPINPDRIVTGIVSKNGRQALPIPTAAKDLVCPNCGSSRGWWNPCWDAWSCSENECLEAHKWLKDPHSYARREIYPDLSEEKVDHFGIPTLYQGLSLSKADLSSSQRRCLMEMASKPSETLLLIGQAGRGKTYAACAALNECRASKVLSVRFVNVSELYLLWKQYIREQADDLDLAQTYSLPHLLLVDDLGTRTPTDAFLDFLYYIVNSRINENKGTIFTTNMDGDQMREKLGESLTSRICSGKVLKFEGKDRRIKLT